MWEKIKNFFKWIADHTGISWVARKISSGWKWLFGGKASATQQSTSQQEKSSGNERQQEPAQANDQSKDHTTPKTPAPSEPTPAAEPETPGGDSSVNQSTPLPYEPLKTTTQEPAQPTLDEKPQKSVVNKRKESELKLNTALNGVDLSLKQALVVQDYKSHNVNANGPFTELLIYIKCGKDEYRVVGLTLESPSSIFNVPIVSIVKKNENGEYLDSNIKYLVNKDVKEMLGLKDDVTTVKVDSISNKPFEAPTLEQPNLNTTTTQPVVNNDSNKEVAAEEHAFKDDDKEADNPQPEISANGSAPTDSSSFDIVSSQATTPDELQEPDEDKELARQSEANQEAPANDDGPNPLVAKPEVQTASNDLSHESQS